MFDRNSVQLLLNSVAFAVFLVSELQAMQIITSRTVKDTKVEKKILPLHDLQAICKVLKLSDSDQQQTSDLFLSIENEVSLPKMSLAKELYIVVLQDIRHFTQSKQ